VQEDVWIQNMQAFWMLVDMVAFIMMGFTDSRDPISFGPRDWLIVVLALLMTGPLAYILSPGRGCRSFSSSC